jgi:hypothetical protein
MRLHKNAMSTTGTPDTGDDFEALSIGPWRFDDGKPITIICAQLPPEMLERMPYTEPDDPDFVALYTYADLDSLFELHGHLHAAKPTHEVNYRTTQRLQSDDYTTHLVSLGGVDWNRATGSLLNQLQLPLRQVTDWISTEDAYSQVEDNGQILHTGTNSIVIFFVQSRAAADSPEWIAQRLAFLLLLDLVRLQKRLAAELIRPLRSLKPIASSRQASARDQMIGSGRPLRGPTSTRVPCPTRGMATAA